MIFGKLKKLTSRTYQHGLFQRNTEKFITGIYNNSLIYKRNEHPEKGV